MKINSIYKKTIFNHKRALIFWGLGIVLIGLFYASIFPSIGGNQQFVDAFSSNSGPAMQAFIVSGQFFSTPNGFIHAEFFSLTMPLIICIMSITIGSSLVSKEENSGTLELLLARPVSRSKLILQKFAGLISIVLALSIFIWLGLFFGSLLVSKFDITLSYVAITTANLGLEGLVFGSIALLITCVKNSRAISAGLTGVYFILSYIIGTFAEQVTWLKKTEDFSLFHYFNSADILQGHAKFSDFLVLGSISIVALGISIWAFSRRDTGK